MARPEWTRWPSYAREEAAPSDVGVIECTRHQAAEILKGSAGGEIRGLQAALDMVEKRLETSDLFVQKSLLDISDEIQQIIEACCVIPPDNCQ